MPETPTPLLGRASAASAGLGATIGLLGLIGVVTGWTLLPVIPAGGALPTPFAYASILLISGGVLGLAWPRLPRPGRIGIAAYATLILVGCLASLTAHVLPVPAAAGVLATLRTLRPIGAVTLGSAAGALLVTATGRARPLAGPLAVVVVVIGWVYLLALAYSGRLVASQEAPPVTIWAAVAALGYGVGLVTAGGPDAWPNRLFVGDSVGAMLMRWLVPIVAIAVIVTDLATVHLFSSFSATLGSALNTLTSVTVVLVTVLYLGRVIGGRLDRAHAALADSERRFSSVFRESPVALSVADLVTYKLVAVNPAFLRVHGAEREKDVLGKSRVELGIWDAADMEERLLKPMRATGRVQGVLMPGRRLTGEPRTFEIHAVRYEVDGTPYSLATSMDVTDRLEAEAERRRAEQRFRDLVEGVRDVVFTLSPDGTITMLNPAFEKLTGLPVAEWIGRSFHEVIHPDDRERAAAELAESMQGRPRDTPPLRIRKAEGFLLAEVNTAPKIEDGQVVSILGIGRDVSERAALEEQLRHAQKMDALGTLAGGIAHDFNNILSAINGNADLALDDLAEGHPQRGYVAEIARAGARAKDLVRRILLFSRKQESHRAPMDLGAVVEEAAKLLTASLPKSIDLRLELASGLPLVSADGTQIHQVVMNLGTNAGHAMRERGGTLTLALDRTEVGAVPPAPGLPPGSYVRLSVRDTGSGMTREVLARVFEPFFTTKGHDGTGLGLSVVHGIMRDHEGAITVESEVGVGTAFALYFPALDVAAAPSTHRKTELPRGAGQRVMYVDDEAALVRVTTKILERLGYRAEGFAGPEPALAALRQDPAAFDAVVTDLSMPGMSGLEMAQTMLAIRPDLPIALTSGTRDETEQARRAGVRVVFQKPVAMEELATAMHALLVG